MPRRTPLVIGHRGAPGYRPEHTRSSYDLALEFGVDAVEPDVVFTKDHVAVVRHENEIGSTTDVADHPEFADRRVTKTIDGRDLTGWFTEDFTWDELATLRCRERLPKLRPRSASFDGAQPILRLRELLDLVRRVGLEQGREIGVVLEIKHATYFSGLGYDVAGLLAAELAAASWDAGQLPLWVESFEQTVLTQLRDRGIRGSYIYLLEAAGKPFDLVATRGLDAPTYGAQLAPKGLERLATEVDGISLDKKIVLGDRSGKVGPASVVAAAKALDLRVFTWTARPENAFLAGPFRRGRDKAAHGDWQGEWRMLADAGVDGVFVDHPDLGVEFFRSLAR
ncbi:glycerophosphodiester phosphodiesterase family protein [Microbacterium dauci]|uniref:glycerophosphodiester phosphodiesterase n=1 Tax=Microbacterium dauci TaxID=3048008 RepID=A0ABT6ZHD0_9MICO|nr:glycerophosphodiester phosphodiesterase family protein [Microbacterium sp. LX3-4]MDJ1115571.1 glycerophosphodiester phosphodiesterase family protein [Microbacterium sp. LX3-4]